jgi:hypothetical protein
MLKKTLVVLNVSQPWEKSSAHFLAMNEGLTLLISLAKYSYSCNSDKSKDLTFGIHPIKIRNALKDILKLGRLFTCFIMERLNQDSMCRDKAESLWIWPTLPCVHMASYHT